MAKLSPKPFTAGLPDHHDFKYDEPIPGYKDFSDLMKAEDKKLRELEAISEKIDYNNPKASLVGAIVSFPVGDGGAYYIVTKDKPLTLAHIPFGDAYHAMWPTIKGVTAAWIRQVNGMDIRFGGNRGR